MSTAQHAPRTAPQDGRYARWGSPLGAWHHINPLASRTRCGRDLPARGYVEFASELPGGRRHCRVCGGTA